MTCPYCTAREAGAYGLHIATACRRCNAVLFRACLHAQDDDTIAARMSWLQRHDHHIERHAQFLQRVAPCNRTERRPRIGIIGTRRDARTLHSRRQRLNVKCRTGTAAPRPGWRGLVLAACWLPCWPLRAAARSRWPYNQSTTLVYWWLDGLVDFDRRQTRPVKDALAATLAWHRQTQLPAVIEDLERLKAESLQDATAAQACGWWRRALSHRDAILSQAAPDLADIAVTLTPAQLRHLERKLTERDEKWRQERMQTDPAEREREQTERLVERIERIYGTVSKEQTVWLSDRLRRSPWDPARWLTERQAHQRTTLESLRQLQGRPAGPEAVAATRRWLERITQPSSDTMRIEIDRLTQHQCTVSADFHNRTTARATPACE